MIKFFRNIRRKLLSENRLSRYMLYAIGEIVLVVIGILIALKISNLNDAKKLRQRELTLLTQMQGNLQSDLKDLEFNIVGNANRTLSNEAIVRAIQEQLPHHDSLNYHFGNLLGGYQLTENIAAWENLKSVGVDLVSDDSLRNALSNLYSNRYTYLESLELELDNVYQWDYLYPQILKHLNIEKLWASGTARDYDQLLQDDEFVEVLKMNITFRKFIQDQYIELRIIIRSILDQIDQHLRTLKV